MIGQRLTTVIAERTNIQADREVKSSECVEREKFLSKIPILSYEYARAAVEEAKRYTNKSQIVLL